MPTTMNFNVSRSGNTTGAATLDWSVVPTGQKPAGAIDFGGGTLPSGTVEFDDGETSQTITLTLADTARQGRTFAVKLSDPSTGLIRRGSINSVIAVAVFSIEAA